MISGDNLVPASTAEMTVTEEDEVAAGVSVAMRPKCREMKDNRQPLDTAISGKKSPARYRDPNNDHEAVLILISSE